MVIGLAERPGASVRPVAVVREIFQRERLRLQAILLTQPGRRDADEIRDRLALLNRLEPTELDRLGTVAAP